MIDQTFSAENFRKIFDSENRKGSYLEGRFFPDIHECSQKIKRLNLFLKKNEKLKNKFVISSAAHLKRKDLFNSAKQEIVEKRNELINKELELVSKEVNSKSFRLELSSVPLGNKPMFTLGKDVFSYFTGKKIQWNLKKIYDVKQSSRTEIISQLKVTLNNDFPKYIIKTDVTGFYESICRKKLMSLVNNSSLLMYTSKHLISQILKKYEKLTGEAKGIPRGIGVSAYLSEIYMLDIDEQIKDIPDVIYYARYVDDIVVVFSPSKIGNQEKYLAKIEEIIESNNLLLNKTNGKTKEIDLLKEGLAKEFSYLGYGIKIGGGKVAVKIGSNKIDKYKARINESFAQYEKKYKYNKKKEEKILFDRIKFLTSNMRLLNSKHAIIVGVFYSNSLVDNADDLKGLDKYLMHKIKSIRNDSLREKLSKFSFFSGFNDRIFSVFNSSELSDIKKVWKNV